LLLPPDGLAAVELDELLAAPWRLVTKLGSAGRGWPPAVLIPEFAPGFAPG
jgi:hypothetical protein